MKFLKLHVEGRSMLVNLSLVTEVYPKNGTNKSNLYLIGPQHGQVIIMVDESLDEVLHKIESGW